MNQLQRETKPGTEIEKGIQRFELNAGGKNPDTEIGKGMQRFEPKAEKKETRYRDRKRKTEI
jgi:hypothetical protein